MNPNLTSVYASLASRAITPQVQIQSVLPLGKNSFKVVASVHAVDGEDSFALAIASLTDGKGRVIPDSYKARGKLAVAVVVANAQSKPMDASFSMVTASTAVDPSGNIWRVEADGAGKRVVLESSDDLAGIFSDRMARRTMHLNPAEGRGLATASVANGDLVRYVDVDTASTSWGIALRGETGLKVFGPEKAARTVNPSAVIASVPRAHLPKELASAVQPYEANAALSADKMSKIMEFLKKAYGPASSEMMTQYRKLAKAA